MSESIRVGKYMTAEPLDWYGEMYEVRGRDGSTLGYTEWYPKWRRFVFRPDNYVVLSSDCCAAMAAFLSEQKPQGTDRWHGATGMNSRMNGMRRPTRGRDMTWNRHMIAALFVQKGGVYWNLPGVDPWDEERDARKYDGPWPVVAHPPCSRWCRLAGLVQKRWGHKKGDDGGMFASALASVRRWGGVLEHPAWSDAWPAHGLPRPARSGGWTRDFWGGWGCCVEQGNYGHPAKKATWLYMCGVVPPPLKWGYTPDNESQALVSWCGNRTKADDKRKRLRAKEASATPLAFRDVLISIARSCRTG
jgi:hypothetical protein